MGSLDETSEERKPPEALRTQRRWVRWRYFEKGSKGKDKQYDKVPVDANGKRLEWGDPQTWEDYETVAASGEHLGFILGDGIGGIDIDACRNPDTGEIDWGARELIEGFDSYTEISPSGTGVKIYALGAPGCLPTNVIDVDGEPINGKEPQIEVYVSGRFFAFTGQHLEGTPHEVADNAEAWRKIRERLKEEKARNNGSFAGRDDALFRLGCGKRACGADDSEVEAYITHLNQSAGAETHQNFADNGALDTRQVDKVIRQVCKYPVGSPEIGEMNEKHAFIHHWGAKPQVLSWRYDADTERTVAVPQSMADIRARYDNRRVAVGEEKTAGLGSYWLNHPARREFDTIGFAPEQDVPNMLNLWRGFGVSPEQGDWSRIKAHLWRRIACEDEESYRYIYRWLAWCVQNPGKPAEVALVLRGGRGTGKGMLARAVMRIFGQHAIHLSNPSQVSGGFNAHHEDCALMFADEAVAPNNKKAREDLKRTITEPTLFIERKGIDAYPVKNRMKVIMASNDDWVIPAGADERRFAVFDVADKQPDDADYFSKLNAEIQGDGPAAMLHELRGFDLGNWHPRYDIPQTEALQKQKTHSLRPVEVAMRDLLDEGSIEGFYRGVKMKGDWLFIPTDTLIERISKRSAYRANGNELSSLLSDRLGFKKGRPRPAKAHGYWFPPLGEARERWDEAIGAHGWDRETQWELIESEREDVPF